MKKQHKGIIYKIKDIGIVRRYGFRDGGYIVVGQYYRNHRPVKNSTDIIFSERGTIVETYAKACGINREDQLDKLVNLEVDVLEETEEHFGSLFNVDYLTRPFKISDKLCLDRYERIVGRSELIEGEEECI